MLWSGKRPADPGDVRDVELAVRPPRWCPHRRDQRHDRPAARALAGDDHYGGVDGAEARARHRSGSAPV